MVAQNQNVKLQMQHQAVFGSGLSLSKVTSQNIFVSDYLDPDIYSIQGNDQFFSKPSNIDPHISCLRSYSQLVTPLSCNLETDNTKPNFKKIFVSNFMAPDLSAGIDSEQVTVLGFFEPFLLISSCHDFEKVDIGRKMSSQLLIFMSGDLNYIFPRYVFSLSFVSLKKYTQQKLNNLMWLRMAGEFMSIHFHLYNYLDNVSFLDCR